MWPTTRAISVSLPNPWESTPTARDPMKPSKFSIKNPGRTMLPPRLSKDIPSRVSTLPTSNSNLSHQAPYNRAQFPASLDATHRTHHPSFVQEGSSSNTPVHRHQTRAPDPQVAVQKPSPTSVMLSGSFMLRGQQLRLPFLVSPLHRPCSQDRDMPIR